MADYFGKFKNLFKGGEDDSDYDDYYSDEEEQTEEKPASAPAPDNTYEEEYDSADDEKDNVINIHDSSKVQFMLFRPESYDKDITKIADEFIHRNTVILNLEQTNQDVSKRIIDFLSGVAYAHSGKVSRLAEDIYIVMPSNVSLTGQDMLDEVESENVYF